MIIGMDIGTTGCKAILFDLEGKQLFEAYREYDLIFPGNGFIELDSTRIIDLIKECIKEITAANRGGIDAICFSVFGGALTAINRSGNLAHRTIVAFDPRGEEQLEWFLSKISPEEYYKITGSSMTTSNPLINMLWIRDNLKGRIPEDFKFISFEEFIYLNFGVDIKISYSLASNLGAFDNNRMGWSGKILGICGFGEDNFYEPVQSGTVLGEIPSSIRKELGLKARTKIICGGFDQCCATLGAGAIKKGTAANGMGTVESFISVLDSFCPDVNFVKSRLIQPCHVAGGKFILLSFVFSAGSIIKWFRDVLGYEDIVRAKESGMNFYEYIFGNIPEAPDEDLYLLPHFAGSGTPFMDENSRGLIMGLNLNTGRSDIVRAIIEGIIFEVKLNMEIMEQSGIRIDEIMAAGGGSKSEKWLKLKADILGKPVYSLEVNEAGCTACFILALKGLGITGDMESAVEIAVKRKKEFIPDPGGIYREIYERKFSRYKKIYPFIKDMLRGNSG